MNYVYTILFIFLISFLLTYYFFKRSNEIWKGKLIKKKFLIEKESNKTIYYLYFETYNNKIKEILTYDKEYWDKWEIGDRGEKIDEDRYPRQI